MVNPCAHNSCSRVSTFQCVDCKKNFCQTHVQTHTGRAKPLDQQMFSLADQYNELQPKKIFQNYKIHLDQMKRDAIQRVNAAYDEHCNKVEQKLRTPGTALVDGQAKWNEYETRAQVTHQQMDEIQAQIAPLEKEITDIRLIRANGHINPPLVKILDSTFANSKPLIPIHFIVPSLPVQPTMMPPTTLANPVATALAPTSIPVPTASIDTAPLAASNFLPLHPESKLSKANSFPVPENPGPTVENQFSFPTNYRAFNCSNKSGVAMASSQRNLLINENGRLMLLNMDFRIVKSMVWTSEIIYDLAWLEEIQRYLIVTDRRTIYSVDSNDISTVEQIDNIPEEHWWSIATSDQSMFVSTHGINPIIFHFEPLLKFRIKKKYKSPYLCQTSEYVQQIRANDDRIAVIISDSNARTAKCDVRSSKTFQLLWSSSLASTTNSYQTNIRCCFLPTDELLVIYEDKTQVLHIDRSGNCEIVEHKRPVWNGVLLNRQKLIIRTDRYVLVYSLESNK